MRRRCVAERHRNRLGVTYDETWHILGGEPADDFAPILCDDQEGIVLPGHIQVREPTCSACVAAAVVRRKTAAAAPQEPTPEQGT